MEENKTRKASDCPYEHHRQFKSSLRKAASDWFSKHSYDTQAKMPYCLEKREDWHNNIICSKVAEYIDKEKKRHIDNNVTFPLHKYLHHGLSSQAMTFNLLGPLFCGNDLQPLRQALENIGVEWPAGKLEYKFEHCARDVFKESPGQPTSFDAAIVGDNSGIFIEVKLAEQAFGGCSVFSNGDCEGRNPYPDKLEDCHLHLLGRTYWERMRENELAASNLVSGAICPFTNYYQFFREVLYAVVNNGVFILLHDERNPTFFKMRDREERGLWPFLVESIPQSLRPKIGRLTIQSLVQAIEQTKRHRCWIPEFKEKYGMTQFK